MQIIQAYLVGLLIRDCKAAYFSSDSSNSSNSSSNTTSQASFIYCYCLLIVVCQAIKVQMTYIYGHCVCRIGLRMRTALSSLIYYKVLRLSSGAIRETAQLNVISIFNNDLMKLESLNYYLAYPPIIVFISILVEILLYQYL